MNKSVELFSSSTCTRCDKLVTYLEKIGVNVSKRLIDDPEIKTEALLLKILSVPALVINSKVLKQKEIFEGERLNEKNILSFIGA